MAKYIYIPLITIC